MIKKYNIYFSIITLIILIIIDSGAGKFFFLILAGFAYMVGYVIAAKNESEIESKNKLSQKISHLSDEAEHHQETLLRKRRILLRRGDYNELIDKYWHDEIFNFANISIGHHSVTYICENHPRGEAAIISVVDMVIDNYEKNHPSIDEEVVDVNSMTGVDYEQYCLRILTKHGWETRGTSVTGDQGVDLISKKGDLKIAIQCKRHSSPVGNYAVQEINAGIYYWEADIGIVISNAGYTKSAKELANKLSIILIHHEEIPDLDKKISAHRQLLK